MRFNFQAKLIAFAATILVAVQVLSAAAVYLSTRNAAIDDLREQLVANERVFVNHLDNTTRNMVDTTSAVTLDFAFRSAIAQGDEQTKRSVMENFRDRVAADRVFLVTLDNQITTDSGRETRTVRPFGFPDLIEAAEVEGYSSDIVVFDNRLYELVIVPVLAPDVIAWIAFAVEMDDSMAAEIKRLAPFPTWISFVIDNGGSRTLVGSTARGDERGLLRQHINETAEFSKEPQLVEVGGGTYVTAATEIQGTGRDETVLLMFHSTIDPALARTRELLVQFGILLVAALALTLAGAILLARTITRPIRQLTTAAGKVRQGDYGATVVYSNRDEFGELSDTFNKMIADIHNRERTISHQARHDSLTGLPNRREFLQQVSKRASSDGRTPFAAVIVGLERVQEMNSSLGFVVGDRIIKGVADRLREHVAEGDLIARIGGDEFGLLLKGSEWVAGGESMLANLIKTVEQPITAREGNVDVNLRFGLAYFPEHGEDGAGLVMSAELAMYKARLSGKATHLFDPVADRPRPEALMLMGEMRKGLDSGQFSLVYQPKVDVATGRIVGAEALSRWSHPQMKNLSPDTFVPLAEQTGNVRYLTRWMLQQAASDCARWRAMGLDMKVSVNLSAKDIATDDIVMVISRLLVEHGVPAEAVTLEITESALMDEPEEALATLDSLSAMGLSLSVDDFGTGYSSMSYLKRLPANELKIDKSFVLDLAHSREDEVIVKSTIDLGRNLGLSVTAEGVEDQNGFMKLREFGCTIAQGYYIARPLPFDRLVDFCRTSPWAVGDSKPTVVAGQSVTRSEDT